MASNRKLLGQREPAPLCSWEIVCARSCLCERGVSHVGSAGKSAPGQSYLYHFLWELVSFASGNMLFVVFLCYSPRECLRESAQKFSQYKFQDSLPNGIYNIAFRDTFRRQCSTSFPCAYAPTIVQERSQTECPPKRIFPESVSQIRPSPFTERVF